MSIERPDDSTPPDLQSGFGLDPWANKNAMLQVQQPGLDNGPAYSSGNLPMLQFIDRTTGPGQINSGADLANRVGQIDPRLSQNRAFG